MDKIKTILSSYRQISLEPVFLLFCVNLGLIGIASQALYVEKACKVNLNQTEAICDNIYNHSDTQKETQKAQKTQKEAIGLIRKARDTEAGKIMSSVSCLSNR